MNEAKILDCPFCGRQPTILNHTHRVSVMCSCAGDGGPIAEVHAMTEKIAVTGWNNRAVGQQPESAPTAEAIAGSLQRPGSVEWPDIGKDPLKYRDEVKGGVEGAKERLGQACAVQQKGVPDQTALVWRIDLDRISCELIVMTARWNSRPAKDTPLNS